MPVAQKTYALYQRFLRYPKGKQLFSLVYARVAPYFWTVRPQVREVRPHLSLIHISEPTRRS